MDKGFFEFKAQLSTYFQDIEPFLLKKIESWQERKQFNIKLCLEEAVTNAIDWGSENSDSSVIIRYKLKNNIFVFSVKDYGKGFNPDEVPDCTLDERLNLPYGRGIFLMKACSDKLFYNKKGNIITMVFYKDWKSK